MSLPETMSFSGSIVMLGYFLLNPVLKRLFGAKCRYLILIMAMFFYLVPVPLACDRKPALRYFAYEDQNGNKAYDLSGKVITVTHEGEIYFPYMAEKITIFAIWSIVAVTVVFAGLNAYGRQRKALLEAGRDVAERETLAALEEIRAELGIRRQIMYKRSRILEAPASVGVFRPALVLPEQTYRDEESRFIYAHELLHIRNLDTLFRLLGLLVIGFNWYNPLAYLLFRELRKVSENICDEQIALHCSREQKIRYGHMILAAVTEDKKKDSVYAAPFGSGKENVKERILLMMKTRKMKTGRKLLAACLMAAIGLSASIPAMAYERPLIELDETGEAAHSVRLGTQVEEAFVENGFEIQGDDVSFVFSDMSSAYIEEFPADSYFQDLQGNIYVEEEITVQSECSHSYVSGTQTKHEKDGESCTVYVYNAKRCSKCGNVILGSLEQQLYYAKCPH